ncbi:YfcE family phosphodiesterase [Agrilactobacillus fermenti]|uniref:YfcE family phosphodiesterase n=1 Tax=Agrilactobacillus fermenti TaxID=2586909 RepID=UPI003A5C2675
MEYLVVSDNHGDQDILQKLLAVYGNRVDAFIHCGDSELTFTDELVSKMTIVRGNMDFDDRFPLTMILKNTVDKIFVAHGHRLNVNFGLDQLYLAALKVQANIAFYGHTHQLGCTMSNGVFILNPGSISQPRGEYAALGGTFALVHSDEKKIVADYYDRQLKQVKTLHFEFKK